MIRQEDINAFMKQGNDAYLAGKAEESPYSEYSEEGRLWLRGYCNAKHMSALESR